MDVINHLLYSHDCERTKENIIQCYTFLLCDYIGLSQWVLSPDTGFMDFPI